MIISVIGCGNVGANLLQHIADVPSIDKILAVDVADDLVKAAIMDVAGFKPHSAHKIRGTTPSGLDEADLVVITAGFKREKGESGREVMKKNLSTIDQILEEAQVRASTIIIAIPGPVDVIAPYIQKKSDLPRHQVIGFGGDLDLNRLIYVLDEQGIDSNRAAIVGEHGSRAIPVYDTEEGYDLVANRVRTFLAEIGRLAGQKRNLATAPLLGDLIRSIVEDRGDIRYVSNYHADYGMYLTWPFRLGRKGILGAEPLVLPPQAQREFDVLLKTKKAEMEGELRDIMG